jgi:hypothetical protein
MTATSIALHEVICDHPRNAARAYGLTFHDKATAETYAREMRAAGYRADVSPTFGTEPTLASALASAALFFRDERLEDTDK